MILSVVNHWSTSSRLLPGTAASFPSKFSILSIERFYSAAPLQSERFAFKSLAIGLLLKFSEPQYPRQTNGCGKRLTWKSTHEMLSTVPVRWYYNHCHHSTMYLRHREDKFQTCALNSLRNEVGKLWGMTRVWTSKYIIWNLSQCVTNLPFQICLLPLPTLPLFPLVGKDHLWGSSPLTIFPQSSTEITFFFFLFTFFKLTSSERPF